MNTKPARQVIVFVIILMVLSSVYLLYQGYMDVKLTHVRAMDLISEQQNKRNYLTTMYSSARERSLISAANSTLAAWSSR